MPEEALFPEQILWPDHERGPWVVRAYFAVGTGRAECVGLTIWHSVLGDTHPGFESFQPLEGTEITPLKAGDLRNLPIGRIVGILREQRAATWRQWIAGLADELNDDDVAGVSELGWNDPHLFDPKSGRPPDPRTNPIYGQEHFENVVRVYKAAWDQHQAPTKAVAEHFHVSRTAAGKWVARSRAMGLLDPTTPGRAGGLRSAKKSATKRRKRT
jgi:hypothetical protein